MGVTARVIVTLEIDAKSNWNDDVMASQVRKQAIVDAKDELGKLVGSVNHSMRIIGEPKVTVVTFDAE